MSFIVLSICYVSLDHSAKFVLNKISQGGGGRGGSVVELQTLEREVQGSNPRTALYCP